MYSKDKQYYVWRGQLFKIKGEYLQYVGVDWLLGSFAVTLKRLGPDGVVGLYFTPVSHQLTSGGYVQ